MHHTCALERDMPYIRSGADAHGVSVFLRDGERIFHTYSAYARGVDPLLGTYSYLDLTPLGRQKHVSESRIATGTTRARDGRGIGDPMAWA